MEYTKYKKMEKLDLKAFWRFFFLMHAATLNIESRPTFYVDFDYNARLDPCLNILIHHYLSQGNSLTGTRNSFASTYEQLFYGYEKLFFTASRNSFTGTRSSFTASINSFTAPTKVRDEALRHRATSRQRAAAP